jgi:hypothetical protein
MGRFQYYMDKTVILRSQTVRRVFVIGLVVFLWICQVAGIPVTQQDIQTVAKDFIASVFPYGTHFEISQVIPIHNGSNVAMYIVNLKPEGWMMLSGDDKATPVLGYSASGSFEKDYSEQGEVGYWMNFYSRTMEEVIRDRKLVRNVLWNGSPGYWQLKSTAVTAVEPMISVTWDQGKSWNILCPSDENGPGGHVYVGCVGVSMAQAMSFYHYPLQGTGSRTYYQSPYGTIIVHYDRESPYQWDSMALEAPDKYNAKLLYHCAVSVGMDFGADGSSAQTKNIPTALSKYFKYFSGAKYVERYASDSTWTALLAAELTAGRPLIYSGFPPDNTVGHAFNIDGIDSRGYFHLNWGWNGKYNGYFLINNLRPGTNNFTENQGAVVNIRPPVYCPTDLDLTKKSIKEGMPASTYVGMLKITDEAKDNVYVIQVKEDSVEEDTVLSPDFYISNDSLKSSKVFLYDTKSEFTIYIRVQDQFGHSYQEKFTISILKDAPTAIADINESGIEVYPNPSSGLVNIKNPYSGRFTVDITDQWGRLVSHLESEGTAKILQFNPQVQGLYFFRITPENGIPVTRKLIIR